MDFKRPSRADLRPLLLLVFTLIAVRILFIALMPAVYSKDLHAWLRVMDVLQAGGNPYAQTTVLNWPPFWMQILFGIHHFCKRTGLSPIHGVQAVLIGSEVLVLCASWIIGRSWAPPKALFKQLLFGLALNPVAVFLSCQHCNYDVLVGLWILLSAGMLMAWHNTARTEYWLAACLFIGMGILAKTVPMMLAPLLFTGLKKLPWSLRIFGAALVFLPFAIGMSVLFTLEPHGVMSNVAGYRSMGGWYGFSGLLSMAGADRLGYAFKLLSPFMLIGAMCCAAWISYRREPGDSRIILVRAALLMTFVSTFGPGYTPPYILWYLPLFVLLYAAVGKAFQRLLLAGFIITVFTYTVEYAAFPSHGAFMQVYFPGARTAAICDFLGSRSSQTMIRLPMFLTYLVTFFALLRVSNNAALLQPAQIFADRD